MLAALVTATATAAEAHGRPERCGVPAVSRSPAPWPSMRHDTHNTGEGSIPAVYRGDRPWSFQTGAGLFITPVLAGNGIVYFGSADHHFYALTPPGKPLLEAHDREHHRRSGRARRLAADGDDRLGDDYLYHLSTDPIGSSRRVVWRYQATRHRCRASSWTGGRTTSPTAPTEHLHRQHGRGRLLVHAVGPAALDVPRPTTRSGRCRPSAPAGAPTGARSTATSSRSTRSRRGPVEQPDARVRGLLAGDRLRRDHLHRLVRLEAVRARSLRPACEVDLRHQRSHLQLARARQNSGRADDANLRRLDRRLGVRADPWRQAEVVL